MRYLLRLLQTEHSQPPQPFLICEVLQPLSYSCGTSLASLQYIHVSLVLWKSELTQDSVCGLTMLSKEERSPPSTFWQQSY